MPLILTATSHENINNSSSNNRPTSRFEYFSDFDDNDFSVLDSRSLRRRQRFNRRTLLQPLLQRYASQYEDEQDSQEDEDEEEEEDEEDDDQEDEDEDEDEDGFIITTTTTTTTNDASNSQDLEDQNDDTITESFSRSRVDIYRLAIRTNSEILQDLAAIIRILRQINALYRVFNSSSNNLGGFLRLRRAGRSRLYSSDTSDEDQEQEDQEQEDQEEEEEANKLLEAGLEDLQAVLSTDSSNNKKQSTLALLALITFQYSHCSDDYLKRYLDPNGEFNPTLAMFAAATYDDDDDDQELKSCRDIMLVAEEIYGPDWLKEFHKGKEGALRKMLEKLTFVAKIRLKVRDLNIPPVIR
ncbi:hypothetical protein MAM1_0184c07483 [Mucor ambiguus]|uniref:Uncharacterized protein n=1 Tax=Mucor ambiguus TaxID=91626 RepID=A0A0C9N066_9FUNG|nr:hypothetical protein MAM1_0184c07483 [Mucor ambiguus]